MTDYDARDPALSRDHNITCVVNEGCEGNVVSVGNASDRSARGLRIAFAGHRNTARFHDGLPAGSLNFVESDGLCEMADAKSSVVVDLWLYTGAKFLLGQRSVLFGVFAAVYNKTTLSIGDDCLFSDQIFIWTSDHHSIIDLETKEQINFPADIAIGNRVWVGQGVHVLKGVHLGEGSIVGARSVVNCSIPRTELWAGVPAKTIKRNVSWVGSHPAHPLHVEALLASLGAT